MANQVHELYGNRTRVRVGGICMNGDSVLLIDHEGVAGSHFWSPPGGGLEFGEDCRTCLAREFLEETGLEVRVGEYLFTCELVKPPLHAIELYFAVIMTGGALTTGHDPESGSDQIIREARFASEADLAKMAPHQLHGIFHLGYNLTQIPTIRGYFKL